MKYKTESFLRDRQNINHFGNSRLGAVVGVALVVVSMVWMAPRAGAETLVTYMFSNYASNAQAVPPDAGSVAANFTAGNLTNFADSAGSAFSGTTDAYFARSSVLVSTEAGAVSGNDYISFTIAPQGGFMLDLAQIAFKLGATAAAVSYTVNTALRSSADGFVLNIGTYSGTFSNTGSSPVYNSESANLGGSSFQNLTDPIEFRFYFWDNLSDGTNYILRFDELVVNGAVTVIPEPAVSAIVVTAALGLLVVLRRVNLEFRRCRVARPAR